MKLAAVKNGSVLTFFPFSDGILIHSLQLAQSRGPARLILRSQRIQVWLRDDPPPLIEDLEPALAQFGGIASDLKR